MTVRKSLILNVVTARKDCARAGSRNMTFTLRSLTQLELLFFFFPYSEFTKNGNSDCEKIEIAETVDVSVLQVPREVFAKPRVGVSADVTTQKNTTNTKLKFTQEKNKKDNRGK